MAKGCTNIRDEGEDDTPGARGRGGWSDDFALGGSWYELLQGVPV